MQFKLRNPMVPFIVLCNVRNLFKYAFESAFFHARIQKNEMLHKSAIFDISSWNFKYWLILMGSITHIPVKQIKNIYFF